MWYIRVWCTHECVARGYGCGVRGVYGVCGCVSVPAHAGVPLRLGVVSAHMLMSTFVRDWLCFVYLARSDHSHDKSKPRAP